MHYSADPMEGLHLTADLRDCRCAPQWLCDAQALGRAALSAVLNAGLQPVGQLFHHFPATERGPGGVTATVLLAESHLCIHTWPECAGVTLDVYVCNFGADHSAKARQLLDSLLALFQPGVVQRQAWRRGWEASLDQGLEAQGCAIAPPSTGTGVRSGP